MNLFKLCCSFFLLSSCNAQQKLKVNKDENTMLWQISGKEIKQTSFLFGTFHLMCKDDISFSSQLKAAVTNTNVVYLEMDMDDPSIMLSGLKLMSMKDGAKLQDLYKPEEYAKISSYFKDSLHMPIGMLQTVKPFFLAAMLYPKMMPCKAVSGVEEELMKFAKMQKKEIKGLETMEFQAAVFDSIPYKEQAKELLKSIDSIASYQKYFVKMMSVYKQQQLSSMEGLLKDTEFGMEDHQDLLLNDRNKNWVKQLKNMLPNQSVFVAVGAGHLVGKQGLINLLKKEGYTLTPIYNK